MPPFSLLTLLSSLLLLHQMNSSTSPFVHRTEEEAAKALYIEPVKDVELEAKIKRERATVSKWLEQRKKEKRSNQDEELKANKKYTSFTTETEEAIASNLSAALRSIEQEEQQQKETKTKILHALEVQFEEKTAAAAAAIKAIAAKNLEHYLDKDLHLRLSKAKLLGGMLQGRSDESALPTSAPAPPIFAVPFRLDHKEARELVDEWIRNRWFAPKIQEIVQKQDLDCLYVPFWHYRVESKCEYVARPGWKKLATRYNEKTQRHETRINTEWKPYLKGQIDFSYSFLYLADKLKPSHSSHAILNRLRVWSPRLRVPVTEEAAFPPASTALPTDIQVKVKDIGLNAEQAWATHGGAEEFETARLARVEEYVTDLTKADVVEVKEHKGSEQKVQVCVLLQPCYVVRYKYKNRPYHVVLSGYSGDVDGTRPFSRNKFFLAGMGSLAVLSAGCVAWWHEWFYFASFF
ncbi:hypothetical protein QOT17_017524 [Balamuthia mandrillaris]